MKKKKKLKPITLMKVTRKCMCNHCCWLWKMAYDPKGILSWFEIRALIDGIIGHGKKRPR